jgi:hypothetical protein
MSELSLRQDERQLFIEVELFTFILRNWQWQTSLFRSVIVRLSQGTSALDRAATISRHIEFGYVESAGRL